MAKKNEQVIGDKYLIDSGDVKEIERCGFQFRFMLTDSTTGMHYHFDDTLQIHLFIKGLKLAQERQKREAGNGTGTDNVVNTSASTTYPG